MYIYIYIYIYIDLSLYIYDMIVYNNTGSSVSSARVGSRQVAGSE